MQVDLFDFELPETRIATRPIEPRDAAKMLVVGSDSALQDSAIHALPDWLRPGDLLVSNNTKVIPARLFGKRGEAKVGVTLHKQETLNRWRVFARPAKRLRQGDHLSFADDFSADVIDVGEEGERLLQFSHAGARLIAKLEQHGQMPLPPYIARKRAEDAKDLSDYQTIFAREEGAVAAPTAGLHFTPALLQALEAGGIRRAEVTLHVGAGTFLPVKVENTHDHKMHSEFGIIAADTAKLINTTKAEGGRIIAVGTTSLRLLESAATEEGSIASFAGDTDIFITPGYRFRAVDILLTNFHLPRSTLFMLVSAFCGLEVMQCAYQHAIASQYRFYSYGDACLLFRADATQR